MRRGLTLAMTAACLFGFGMSGSIAAAAGGAVSGIAARSHAQAASKADQLTLIGRAECLVSGKAAPADKDCSGNSLKFVFHAADGKAYGFVSGDPLTAMFTDHRVRERELRIIANRHPEGALELVSIQSIKDGKLYDLYYFCKLCNITAYAPGPCPCCRQELEFVEAPAAEP